ncbi:hypothetical protein X801_01256 [Opisthorchis viverrini]|uniref:Uncharacterized protein n=2 Tax=Opisthorchis viverrini TaxID=6198 RepID=A0A1S8X827_OPIVI|nr:hypothetical protein T265_06644 [Opisthorchis viverrini]KER26008.1 hypothetical protein T265_06644 [Opisthorchis viverrini]OON22837.1 hypothetical protein X801_01256 [Opisthorchis viverrini]
MPYFPLPDKVGASSELASRQYISIYSGSYPTSFEFLIVLCKVKRVPLLNGRCTSYRMPNANVSVRVMLRTQQIHHNYSCSKDSTEVHISVTDCHAHNQT